MWNEALIVQVSSHQVIDKILINKMTKNYNDHWLLFLCAAEIKIETEKPEIEEVSVHSLIQGVPNSVYENTEVGNRIYVTYTYNIHDQLQLKG